MKKRQTILLFWLLGFINVCQADLINLGNGLINDDTLNITWLQDANLFKTLCDANDPIATGFTPIDAASATIVCTNNGAMTWNDAERWIARLNSKNFLGYNDWRQPTTSQPDATCSYQIAANGGNSAQGWGFRCIGSELGNLINNTLSNPNDLDNGCFGTAPHCFQNTLPFINIQISEYWSGSSFSPNLDFAWYYFTSSSIQGLNDKRYGGNKNIWPVRSGQSILAPKDIPTLSAWGLGLMILLLRLVTLRKLQIKL